LWSFYTGQGAAVILCRIGIADHNIAGRLRTSYALSFPGIEYIYGNCASKPYDIVLVRRYEAVWQK